MTVEEAAKATPSTATATTSTSTSHSKIPSTTGAGARNEEQQRQQQHATRTALSFDAPSPPPFLESGRDAARLNGNDDDAYEQSAQQQTNVHVHDHVHAQDHAHAQDHVHVHYDHHYPSSYGSHASHGSSHASSGQQQHDNSQHQSSRQQQPAYQHHSSGGYQHAPYQQQHHAAFQHDPASAFRRHSVATVFPSVPQQQPHISTSYGAPVASRFMPSTRASSSNTNNAALGDIPEGSVATAMSTNTTHALPIGAPARGSAPVSTVDYQSAAQWYFGGAGGPATAQGGPLSNLFGGGAGGTHASATGPGSASVASSMPPSQRGAFPPTMPPRFMPPAQNGMPMRGSMPQFTGGYPQQQQQQQGQLQQQQQQQQGQLQQHAYNPSSLYDSGAGAGASAMYQPGAMLTCFLVQFTSGRTDTYYIPHESHLSVTIGDYVVVEADRGQDLGRVFMDNISVPLPRRNSTTAVVGGSGTSGSSVGGVGGFGPGNDGYAPTFDMDDQQQYNGGNSPVPSNFPKRIYRLAQPVEIESLLAKVRDEINAIAVGQYKVQEWKLPMVIIDAEYQWDRRKLTFFFSVTLPQFYPNQPPPRIDFRTLVRDLYQIYRTRIWMYCVDKDKNRANRAHNREKFLKQLYSDTTKYHRGSAPASTTATMDNTANALAMALGTITPGERSAAETPSPTDHLTGGGMHAGGGAHMDGGASSADWDMSEMFKSIVNVEELTFGINKMGMMPPSSSATVSAINSSTTSPTPDDGHSSSTDPSPTKDVGKLGGVFDAHVGGGGSAFSAVSKAIWAATSSAPGGGFPRAPASSS